MRPWALLLAVALLGAACAPGWNDPVPPSAEYPCTPFGVVCAVQRSCCWEGSVCGGEPGSVGCPAGQCCEVASSLVGMAGGDAGVSMTPQHPMRP